MKISRQRDRGRSLHEQDTFRSLFRGQTAQPSLQGIDQTPQEKKKKPSGDFHLPPQAAEHLE